MSISWVKCFTDHPIEQHSITSCYKYKELLLNNTVLQYYLSSLPKMTSPHPQALKNFSERGLLSVEYQPVCSGPSLILIQTPKLMIILAILNRNATILHSKHSFTNPFTNLNELWSRLVRSFRLVRVHCIVLLYCSVLAVLAMEWTHLCTREQWCVRACHPRCHQPLSDSQTPGTRWTWRKRGNNSDSMWR